MLVFFVEKKTTYSFFSQINDVNNNKKSYLFIRENQNAEKGV